MTDPVLKFTPNALNHIKKNLAQNSSNLGFRLSIKKTGCSGYAYLTDVVASSTPGDIHYEIDGLSVFIDVACIDLVKGTLIDFVDKSLGQTQLIFNNPNAGNLCGCGESFNLPGDKK